MTGPELLDAMMRQWDAGPRCTDDFDHAELREKARVAYSRTIVAIQACGVDLVSPTERAEHRDWLNHFVRAIRRYGVDSDEARGLLADERARMDGRLVR